MFGGFWCFVFFFLLFSFLGLGFFCVVFVFGLFF